MRSAKSRSVLVQATPQDLHLINSWLVRPEIRRWWGSPIDNQAEMKLGVYCPDQVGRVFLILDPSSRPVGLVSLIHARATVHSRVKWSPCLPADSWEIGILITEKQRRRRGLGTKALIEAQKTNLGVSQSPVFAWIEKDNAASLACFTKLGYVRTSENETAGKSWALLRYDPDDNRPK